jgi:uncharacterized protein DUF2795
VEQGAIAELKTALVGVELPADKATLLERAVQHHVEPQQLEALRSLPDREFASLDEVVEELLHVQPVDTGRRATAPHEESGEPPGGGDYTRS